jgi:hypothetical protein
VRDDTAAAEIEERDVLFQWSARKLHPVILLYVALVFLAFMALAYFVLHSVSGVKALAIGAVGATIPLVPAVLRRNEYRLTETGLEKRPIDPKKPRSFTEVFSWQELSRVRPMRRGFKFFLTLDEPRPLRRFWKTHVADAFSGEFHVESEDRERVLGILEERMGAGRCR